MMYFTGNIRKDSIFISNDNEDDYALINKRKPKILDKKYSSLKSILYRTNKEFRQIFKDIPQNRKSYHQNFFLKLGSCTYYFTSGAVTYENNSKSKTIPIHFEEKYLNHIFAQDNFLFLPDFTKRKMIKIKNGLPQYIDADSKFTDPNSKIYWQKITGQILLVHKNNLYKSELKDGKLILKHVIKYDELEHLSVNSIYLDKTFNKIYFGTINRGLNIITMSNFQTSRRKENNIFYSFLPYGKNCVITPKGEIFDSNSSVGHAYKSKENYENISMTDDDNGNLYCISNFKLYKLYKKSAFKLTSLFEFYKNVIWVHRDKDLYYVALSNVKYSYLYVFKNKLSASPDYQFKFF